MSIVRRFPARLVRQEWAQRAVATSSDSSDGARPAPLVGEPAAYEEVDAGLYVYRQRSGGSTHRGVVCEVAMRAFANGRVRGHEAVHADRVAALVQHHATTADRPGPVTLLHRAGPAFTEAVDATCWTPPLLEFAGPTGIEQAVWRIPDGVVAGVAEEVAATDLYIADGHHRVAAALEEWERAGRPPDDGLLCVVHPMDGLRLSAIHRRLAGPVSPSELLRALAPGFRVSAVPAQPTPRPGSYGLYVGRGWYAVTRRGDRRDGSHRLDAEVLQARVLEHLARGGRGRARTVELAPAAAPVAALTQRCDEDGGALFTLAPPPLAVLTGLADAGEVMPPKTTYFEPKPCAGIFLRPERADARATALPIRTGGRPPRRP